MQTVRPILDYRTEIEKAIVDGLPVSHRAGFSRLCEAMHYSVGAKAKRIRPLLCVASFLLFDPDYLKIFPLASAFEWIHTYSLIHDDLPAMDNDDFRRGVATCHRQFDEATAILAGDALNTYAFEWLALELPAHFPADRCLLSIAALAKACGVEGMAGGQMLDMLGQGSGVDLDAVLAIHASKTGALIESSIVVPGILAGASLDVLNCLSDFGQSLGVLFQVIDDILDVTGTSEELGKTALKDVSQDKMTIVRAIGLEAAQAFAGDQHQLVLSHLHHLTDFGLDVVHFEALVDLVTLRRN